MELVTLAHVTLNRVGTAGRHHTFPHKEVQQTRTISDSEPATLRELVITVAGESGEAPDSQEYMRQHMRQVDAWRHSAHAGEIVFDVQGISVQWSNPYAVCHAFPALKIGDRYFRLDEIKLISSVR